MTELIDRLRAALGEAYTIERELGGGGMSHVFLATERRLDRRVVIKLLPPDLAGGVSLERFHREIQLVARLQNPHIVPVITAGEADGVPFFMMPFVEGRSLREMLKSGTMTSVTEGANILRDVATALRYAHERGIVHRDIKPDNVLLSGGAAVVTDFGVAKAISSARAGTAPGGSLTQMGFSLGTPLYMAPEQAAADPSTDHRADIYSFGVMAYELFAGAAPFANRAPAALLTAQMTETPPLLSSTRPDAPLPLVELIRQCLEKDPAKRPQRAAELVEGLDAALMSSGPSASNVAAAPARAAKTNKRVLALAFAALFAIAALAGLLVSRRTSRDAATATATPRSVAVLPLENVGGSDSDRYFSEGITDELTSALGKVPGLRVASRTSVFALRGKGMDATEIAKTLKVSSLLEGTIRRSGDRLRVTAQLTNADGLALWSDRYERQMKDVFQLQDDIAGSIASALRVTFAPTPNGKSGLPPGTAPAGTEDVAAYDLYLRGRFFWHQRGNDALHRAAEYFGQAIDRDPTFARAYAGLADALGLLPINGSTPADSAFPLARKAAEKALSLDSTLAEAHTTLGLILRNTGEWESAATEFRRGIALDSTYATGHQWYAELLNITGRVRDAVKELERARDLEPLSPVINARLGYTLGLAGRYQEGITTGQRAVELDSTLWAGHAYLAFTHLFAGEYPAAVSGFRNAVRHGKGLDPLIGCLAFALAKNGQADSARAVLAPAEAHAKGRGGSPIAVAMGYAGLGERDAALKWLERGAREKDPWLYTMSINAPLFDSIRLDPRFAEAARTMKLDPVVMAKPSKGT